MVQNTPNKDSPSDVVTFDSLRRFKIPKSILVALEWDEGRAPVRLVAEIVDDGRVRLFDKSRIAAVLQSIEAELELAVREEAANYGTLHAFRDRYREVTLRPSDGRIQLPVVLHAVLEPTLETTSLYIELGDNCVEVFSHRARIKRLRRHASETNMQQP